MKRNLDLIRYILLTTEDSDTSELRVADYITSQYSFNEVSYHITLLIEAGYMIALRADNLSSSYPDYIVQRLTYKGHDFLDTIRNDNVFNKTKTIISSTVGTTALSLIKDVALNYAKDMLGI